MAKLEIKYISTNGTIQKDLQPMSNYATGLLLVAFKKPGWKTRIDVPDDVAGNVRSLKKRWDSDGYCIYDDEGHGGVGTILFLWKNLDVEDAIIGDSRLIARISYGRSFEKFKDVAWDMVSYDRIHLSVLGTKFLKSQNDKIIRENAYFTVRWDKGKFDDYSAYAKGKPYATFNSRRATFSQASEYESEYKGLVDDAANFKIIPLDEKMMNEEFGTKSVGKVDVQCPKCKNIFEDWTKRPDYLCHYIHPPLDGAPQVGYDHVLEALSKYGSVSIDDLAMLKDSAPEQGMEYFFSNAVPAMENYLLGKHK